MKSLPKEISISEIEKDFDRYFKVYDMKSHKQFPLFSPKEGWLIKKYLGNRIIAILDSMPLKEMEVPTDKSQAFSLGFNSALREIKDWKDKIYK